MVSSGLTPGAENNQGAHRNRWAAVDQVVLVHRGERVVPALPRAAAFARRIGANSRLGVDVRTGVAVVAASDGGVDLSTAPCTRTVLDDGPAPGPPARHRTPGPRRRPPARCPTSPSATGWSGGRARPARTRGRSASALWAVKAGDQVGPVARALQAVPGSRSASETRSEGGVVHGDDV